MATNLSIGLYHPSKIIPSDVLDLNQLGFITASQHCYAKQIKEFYPSFSLPLRHYMIGSKQLKENNGQDFFRQLLKYDYIPAIKEHSQLGHPVQIVFNELFGIDGSLRHRIKEQTVFAAIDYILRVINNPEIIFNEMNTYRITQYTGNGLQDNGVLRFIQKVKERYPQINVSLGIQTIGNRLCKDLILTSLPILLSHIKNLDWFAFPIHFTEVGYYHEPYQPQNQVAFLDNIKVIAIQYEVSSLCYIYPWDGDYFHLAGQPRNTLCGIWGEDWNVKYDI
jgi:hypothetical protein